jgi:hypothetical protein
MATLNRDEITAALTRLGELAIAQGSSIELVLMGGAVMVLGYAARLSTRDVDALILAPREARQVRAWVEQVAYEHDLPADWLNDGAKGYLKGLSQGAVLFSAPGIVARSPAVAQLLAMKLAAWRDDVDIDDARRLLQDLRGEQARVWALIEPYVIPGYELKAQLAFTDLWESTYGET